MDEQKYRIHGEVVAKRPNAQESRVNAYTINDQGYPVASKLFRFRWEGNEGFIAEVLTDSDGKAMFQLYVGGKTPCAGRWEFWMHDPYRNQDSNIISVQTDGPAGTVNEIDLKFTWEPCVPDTGHEPVVMTEKIVSELAAIPPKPPVVGRPLPKGVGTVSQKFGERVSYYRSLDRRQKAGHPGIDYSVPVGTDVLACFDGIVVASAEMPLLGEYIVVSHGKWESWYAHLDERGVNVGDHVVMGQTIGLSGDTGNSTGPHLHFGIRVPGALNESNSFVDPYALRVMLGG